MQIHHVAGVVGCNCDVLAQDGIEPEPGKGMLHRAIGRGEVEVARGDHHLHVRVLDHGGAQRVGRFRIAHLGLEVPPAHPLAKNVIRNVALVAQLGAKITVEGGRIGPADGGIAGVGAGPGIRRREILDGFVARIEPADRPPPGLEQLFAEDRQLDPELVRFNDLGVQPGVAGQPCGGVARFPRQSAGRRAQDRRVLLVGPLLHFLENCRQAPLLEIGGQPMVVPGNGRV